MAERMFPVLSSARTDEVVAAQRIGCPAIVVQFPWALIAPHEQQAQRNHYQTLERLAQRGGLSACEAMAVLEDREWRKMEPGVANAALLALVMAPAPAPDQTVGGGPG